MTQGRRAKSLFSSAEIGGFANYWGQQFVRYSASELPGSELFRSHTDYEDECSAVERLFCIRGGDLMSVDSTTGYQLSVPRLLTGSSDDPTAGLDSMCRVYQQILNGLGARAYATRAVAMNQEGGDWVVSLEDGEKITARKILLAAGVKGTAHFLLRSFPDLQTVRFRDHGPWVVYVTRLGRLMRTRPENAPMHFNAMTLEKVQDGTCMCFGSVYDLMAADLNLLLASSIGRSSSLVRNRRAPRVVSLVNVVQVWTPSTYDIIDIDAQAGTATAGPRSAKRPEDDGELLNALSMLRSKGARVIRISRTQPGLGFHYHGLRARAPGRSFQGISDLLLQRTQDAVTCVDASTMHDIGRRPHTLTAMASARRMARTAA